MKLRASLKQRTEALLAPLADWLDARGVRPNHISVAGAVLSVLAAWPAATGHFTSAAILFWLGSSVDALDGVLARRFHEETRFGAVLDATLDRIGEGALWAGLVFSFAAHASPGWAMGAAGAMLLSFLTSYLRIWGERFGVAMSEDWLTRPERVIVLGVALLLGMPELAVTLVGTVAALGFGVRLWRLARLL